VLLQQLLLEMIRLVLVVEELPMVEVALSLLVVMVDLELLF
jgi:hypothetical protein